MNKPIKNGLNHIIKSNIEVTLTKENNFITQQNSNGNKDNSQY
jgi:hypothetical protein